MRPLRIDRFIRAIVLLAASLPASAASADPPAIRCRTGLVLGGGGARGGAHVGVLKVLEELRVPVDCVAGTSMGSLVGGLYSAGYSPQEMENLLLTLDWESMFRQAPPRRLISYRRKQDDNLALFPFELGLGRRGFTGRSGVLNGQEIGFLLRSLTLHVGDINDFDDLPLPYRAVAADLDTGDVVVLESGDLAQAMRASMSIPAIFTPVEIDGRMLVDGGIAGNLPIDVARAMGAERVIAVDVGTPPRGVDDEMGALAVYNQMMGVLTKRNVREQLERLEPQDVVLTPDLSLVTTMNFDRIEVAIAAGLEAALGAADRLAALSVSESEYAAHLDRQRRPARDPELSIDTIEIRGAERTEPRLLVRRMKTSPEKPLDLEVLARDLVRVSQAGEFENVAYSILREDERTRLLVDVQEKEWGPSYLRFGLGMETDLEGSSDFRVLAHLRRPHINRFGAEWRTLFSAGEPLAVATEFFQPLVRSGTWFVAPHVHYFRATDRVVLSGGEEELLADREVSGALDFGIQLHNYGELRIGVTRGLRDVDPLTSSTVASIESDTGAATLSATFDQLDSAFFPRRGTAANIDLLLSRGALGADDHYEKLRTSVVTAGSIGRNTLVGRLQLGTDLNSDIPVYDEFELGGFLNLSGLRRGEVRGDVLALATLLDYWRLGRVGSQGHLYGGVGLEFGNAWPNSSDAGLNDLRYSGLLFFGVDTPLSPIYAGYAQADAGEGTFYIFIGRPL